MVPFSTFKIANFKTLMYNGELILSDITYLQNNGKVCITYHRTRDTLYMYVFHRHVISRTPVTREPLSEENEQKVTLQNLVLYTSLHITSHITNNSGYWNCCLWQQFQLKGSMTPRFSWLSNHCTETTGYNRWSHRSTNLSVFPETWISRRVNISWSHKQSRFITAFWLI